MERHRSQPLQDPWPAVQAAVRRLREAHEIGRRILKKAKTRGKYGEHQVLEIAREHGFGEEAGRNLRRLAKTFTKDELDRLCDCCRQHRRALGLWAVFKLLTIPDHRSRTAFATEAIAGHWSYTRMERELRHRFARDTTPRGRKPRLPDSQGETLVRLGELSYGFIRFANRLQDERKEWLPDRLKVELTQAVAALTSLQQAAARSLARSQAGQAGKARRSRQRS